MDAAVENAIIHFIVRDFETSKLVEHEARLEDYAKATCAAFPSTKYTFTVKEQYRNMREMLDRHPQVMAHAMEAYKRAGMNPVTESIRGGTDGSRLSFMGMPCPNIFTGEMAIHSRKEYVSVQDMEKAVETLVHLSNIWAE
jgi:tripeptide aminopeptidase